MDFDKILDLIIKELSTYQVDGKFIFDADNIDNIDQVDKVIEKVLKDKGYYDNIEDYSKDFEGALSDSVKEYSKFGAKSDNLLKRFNKIVFDNFKNQMIFGFTETNIKQPIKTALINYVGSGGNFKDFKTSVVDLVSAKKLETNVDLVARELVFQYKRSQQAQLANKFNVKYFRYVGGEIDTTRPFCDKRVGNIYTKDEIQSWASKDWGGKKEGTTSTNIFINLGGYNCRHSLIPVSEEVAKREGFNNYN
jgi:hypothetical protein